MPLQSQSNSLVAYKVQSGLGSPATGAGASILRIAGGAGANLTKASTESNEVRYDGMRTRGRHGIQKTDGSWSGEASIGSFESIIEAVMRDTWTTADLAITQATAGITSITTQAGPPSTITAAAGSWITAGLRVGDVVRLTLHSTASNNSRNLRVTNVTALVLTVAESLATDAAADTTFQITRSGKKLTQTGIAPIKRYFTVEEYEQDIDLSQVIPDFVWGAIRIGMAPNGIVTIDPSGMGTGQFNILTTGTSPTFTTPTATTSLPMAVVDATIRIGSPSSPTLTDMIDLTSFDLTMDISPMAPDVFGSGNIKYGPDIFTGQMGIGINFSCLRRDLQMLSDFAAETQYSISILLAENEAEPKDFFSIYVPNLALGGLTKSAYAKEGGPRTQSVTVPMALVGKDPGLGGSDGTMIKFQSTAP